MGLFFALCYLLGAFMTFNLLLLFFRWIVLDGRGRCRHEEGVKLGVMMSARMLREHRKSAPETNILRYFEPVNDAQLM